MVSLLWIITIVVFALPFILSYAYAGYSVQAIGHATGHGEAWKAWVPIANLFYICEIAGKPGWWVLLLFLPIVNVIFLILIWMEIARALAKPAWSGVLVAFPLVQWPAVGYLAGLRTKTIILAMTVLSVSIVAIPLWGRVMRSTEVRTRLALADLQDRDRDVRVRAMYKLQAIPAEPSRVVPALTGLIREQDPHVRQNAIEALGRMGPSARDAVPALIGTLKDNSLHEIFRLDVVESLHKIAPSDDMVAQAIIEFCVKAAKHPAEEVRGGALRKLGNIGARSAAVVPALIAALEDKSFFIRQIAAEALGEIGPAARDAIPALIVALTRSSPSGYHVERDASDALVRIGAAAVPALIELARSSNCDGVKTLGKIGPAAKDAVPVIMLCLTATSMTSSGRIENYGVRYEAAEALGNIDPAASAAVPALRLALNDKESIVRLDAAEALKKIEGR